MREHVWGWASKMATGENTCGTTMINCGATGIFLRRNSIETHCVSDIMGKIEAK